MDNWISGALVFAAILVALSAFTAIVNHHEKLREEFEAFRAKVEKELNLR